MVDENRYEIWDEIADFDAGSTDEAMDHLNRRLCGLVDGHDAVTLAAVRMNRAADDPLHGWRIGLIRVLGQVPTFDGRGRQANQNIEAGRIDVTTIRNVAGAGCWRVNRLADLVDEAWFHGDYYRNIYLDGGVGDAIWAGCPVNDDAELYLGILRPLDAPRFGEAERDLIGTAVRGLKWFFRQYLLVHGLCVAREPLTAGERAVLAGLLTGGSEKQIAAELGHTVHATHECVRRIYRKFGVRNRPALTALWLGRQPGRDAPARR